MTIHRIKRIALMAERKTKVLAFFLDNVQLIVRQIGTQPVTTVFCEPEVFGDWMKSHANAVSDALGIIFHDARLGIHP